MKVNRHTLTIPNGESLSNTLTLRPEEYITAIETPSAWTAAGISFVSAWATNKAIYKDGSEYTLTVSTNQYHIIDPANLAGSKKIAIRSGTTATPVNQAAARDITVITTEI